MVMEEVLFWLVLALKLFTVYFIGIGLFTLCRRESYQAAPAQTRFAVVVAARNEEAVIGNLVESILHQNYPSALRDIYVVPNNCTDHTEAAAVAAGARILCCSGSVSCKGDALHEAIGRLMARNYDAFVVFDADNIADPDFLQRMNDAIAAGARVCKGRMRVLNPAQSGVSGCYGLYFSFFDWGFNRPRAALGLSAKLVGTGFAVHREVFQTLGGWNTDTISEDAEFAVQCARQGYRVHWVYDAVSYDEAPVRFVTSLHQRRRWCSGVMQTGRQELRNLWASASPRPILRWDMTMFLLSPFAQALSGLLMGANLLVHSAVLLPLLIPGLCTGYLGAVALSVGLCLLDGYDLRDMGRAILVFPLFMATWTPLQILSLFKDTKTWRAIPHTGAISFPARPTVSAVYVPRKS